MTKRRDVVRALMAAGFEPDGGTNHERYVHADGRWTVVPWHREVREQTVRLIERQTGVSVMRVIDGGRSR